MADEESVVDWYRRKEQERSGRMRRVPAAVGQQRARFRPVMPGSEPRRRETLPRHEAERIQKILRDRKIPPCVCPGCGYAFFVRWQIDPQYKPHPVRCQACGAELRVTLRVPDAHPLVIPA